MTVFLCFAAVICGVMTWSFLEYCIHRVLGHDRRTFPNPFGSEHTRHHAEGDYFAPTWKKSLVALAALLLVAPLAVWAVGLLYGPLYAVSFVTMYVSYEVVHRRAHTHAGFTAYGRYLRRHHFHHHFENPRSNHGVTSPIWDVVFGTLEKPSVIHVPRKLQMRWLADPATGEVREAHRPSYELVGKDRARAASPMQERAPAPGPDGLLSDP